MKILWQGSRSKRMKRKRSCTGWNMEWSLNMLTILYKVHFLSMTNSHLLLCGESLWWINTQLEKSIQSWLCQWVSYSLYGMDWKVGIGGIRLEANIKSSGQKLKTPLSGMTFSWVSVRSTSQQQSSVLHNNSQARAIASRVQIIHQTQSFCTVIQ